MVGYAAQTNLGSAELLRLGVHESYLSLAWLAGPLSGLIMQPIVGWLTDVLRTRRPFIFIGAVTTSMSLLYLSNANSITAGIVAFYALDLSLQIVQAPVRAIVTDGVPPKQRPAAAAGLAAASAVGSLSASAIAGYDWVELLKRLSPPTLQAPPPVPVSVSTLAQRVNKAAAAAAQAITHSGHATESMNTGYGRGVIGPAVASTLTSGVYHFMNMTHAQIALFLSAVLVMLFIMPCVLLAPDKPVPDSRKQHGSKHNRVKSHVSDDINSRNPSAKTGDGHGGIFGHANDNSNNNSEVYINDDNDDVDDDEEKLFAGGNNSATLKHTSDKNRPLARGSGGGGSQSKKRRRRSLLFWLRWICVASSPGCFLKRMVHKLRAPRPFWQAFVVQLCTWSGFFVNAVYANFWMGTYIFNGDGSATRGSAWLTRFQDGVRQGSRAAAMGAGVTLMLSLLLARTSMPLRVVYVGSQLCEAVSLSMPWMMQHVFRSRSQHAGMASIALFGVVHAVTNVVPWLIVARALETSERTRQSVGLFTTVFNVSQSLPQLVIGLVAALIMKVIKIDPSAVMLLASVLALLGAALVVVLDVDRLDTGERIVMRRKMKQKVEERE